MRAASFEVVRQLGGHDTITLAGERTGHGTPTVLLHGLSATRRNVVQGSSLLVRRGYELVAYDARGHGASSPARSYTYDDLTDDLGAVLDELALDRVALAGSSMGAATAVAYALRRPERVAVLVLITPAYAGGTGHPGRWEALASALESGGVEAFVAATDPEALPERWRAAVRLAVTQRMERHEHPEAVARALREVPRSSPWGGGLERLAQVSAPALVVGSRDDADPTHPLAVAEEYVRRLPDARLAVEEPGAAPLAWQGGRLSEAIAGFLDSHS